MEFPADDTGVVKRAWLVLDTGGHAQARLGTLLDAPNALRAGAQDADRFQTSFRGFQNRLEINAVESDEIPDVPGFVMLELEFSSPVERRNLFLGGSPAFLERNFIGGVAHVIMADRDLEPEEAGAVRKLLSAMHGISIPAQSVCNMSATLRNLNVKDYACAATLILLR